MRQKNPNLAHLSRIILIALTFMTINLTFCESVSELRQEDFPSKDPTNDESASTESPDYEDKNQSNKFSWRLHQDDHSIYAGRSLMSKANIERQNETDDGEEYAALKTSDFVEKEWQLMFRSFDLMYDSVSSSILHEIARQTNLFDEIVARLKPECKREIYHIRESVKKHRLWALRMLDSNGKIPSGVTYGKFSSPGDYEECLSVNVDELVYKDATSSKPDKHKFRGKYCLLDFRLPLPERPRDKLLSIHEPVLNLTNMEIAKQFPELKNYSGYASVFYEVGYMHAFCLPSTCEITDITKSVGQALEGLYIVVNNTVDCQERFDEPVPLRRSQLVSLTLMCLLFLNAACASIVHHLSNRKKKHESYSKGSESERNRAEKLEKIQSSSLVANLERWISKTILCNKFYSDCFSIQTNFNRLTKPDPRGLTFVHYTRIVAMGLTVVTHTAGLGTLQAITKPADASNSEQIFRDFIPQMLANAFTSIQIFFFMAGFMLVISTYPSISREKGHISFLEYAVKRAIRLMPGIAATIGLNFLWPLVVDGPMLSYFDRLIVQPCESNWWRTMAFLSNFDHVEKMCLRHSYFSASDYQLHIMAFPILILLYKQPVLSLFIAGILTVAGFVAQVIMILTKTVLPFMMVDYIDKEAFFNVVHYIHHPVWNHMSAFFYGFIIGYLVVKQIRIELSETTIKRLWMIILPAGIASIFAPYFWNHYKRPIYRWQMVLYVLFDRFILLTTCAWLSYATMVLGRKPSKPKPAKVTNLPEIISLDQEKENKTNTNFKGEDGLNQPKISADLGKEAPNDPPIRPKLSLSTTSIPRQRSSPNFLTLVAGGEGQPGLRSTISSSNLISIQAASMKSLEGEQHRRVQQDAPTIITQPPQRRTQAPISNVNTLCLILSRLTFQLYLFNMVVLWVDVNHSKYYWFFSYYFIITKAFAVYICSSLMAMIFFVTLESPCLTLYIQWVKSRAQKRADRRTKRETQGESKQTAKPTNLESLT